MKKYIALLAVMFALSASLTACKSLKGDDDKTIDTGDFTEIDGSSSTTTTADGSVNPFGDSSVETRTKTVGAGSSAGDYVEEETSTIYTTKGAAIRDRVFFEYNSSALTAEARETLNNQAAWLKSHADVSITVEGHADERGTREYNLALGESRANATKEYLVSQGVEASRIDTTSLGKEQPAVLGSSETSYAKNRRAVSVKK